jgi:mycothiol synthase
MTTQTTDVSVADAPPIDGLRFRRYAGDADLPGIVELINLENRADGFDEVETVEGLAVHLAHLPNGPAVPDVLVAEIDGTIVGVSWAWWAMRAGEYSYEHTGAVHPAHRGCGLGRAMLRYQERRLRGIASGHDTGRPKWFATWAPDEAVAGQRLFRDEGYEPVRYFFEMTRDLRAEIPAAPLPTGLEIRPVRAEDHRRIYDANVEAFRDHWGAREKGPEDYRRQFEDPDLDTSLWRVAWDGGEVAGVVVNVILPAENEVLGLRRGWLDQVSVRRPWRRRGLARALIASSLQALRGRDMTEAVLGVDAENPTGALGLYEGMGFVVARRATAFRKVMEAPSTG